MGRAKVKAPRGASSSPSRRSYATSHPASAQKAGFVVTPAFKEQQHNLGGVPSAASRRATLQSTPSRMASCVPAFQTVVRAPILAWWMMNRSQGDELQLVSVPIAADALWC
ncbi:hypothetical protein ACP70R_047020 [Stipagrostis hirtigluma subsp. patula]